MEREQKNMRRASTVSQTSIRLRGRTVEGAEDRQRKITGFDQAVFSKSSVLCIGAGGLISHIAPTLVRKGIGRITLLDDDVVEASNLNRQLFYISDIGKNKALALAENLERECIVPTEIRGLGFRLEEAIARDIDLHCDVAICGVDNNPARAAASRQFRIQGIPVIFTGVSRDGDCGYVFVQEKHGPCIGCLYPDMAGDDRYPCPDPVSWCPSARAAEDQRRKRLPRVGGGLEPMGSPILSPWRHFSRSNRPRCFYALAPGCLPLALD